jgi:hypothetical protein
MVEDMLWKRKDLTVIGPAFRMVSSVCYTTCMRRSQELELRLELPETDSL